MFEKRLGRKAQVAQASDIPAPKVLFRIIFIIIIAGALFYFMFRTKNVIFP